MIGSPTQVAVIGAGVVGLAAALALRQAGHDTLLIDAEEPGLGCSFGNAGVIATSFVLPLSDPRHIIAVPRMLLDSTGPLAVRLSDLATVAPWVARFLLNATPTRQRHAINCLKLLNGLALQAWRDLLREMGKQSMLIERGMLEVVRDPRGLASLGRHAIRLGDEGIRLTALTGMQAKDLEPALTGPLYGGLLHEDVAHVQDPYELTCGMLANFREIGGKTRRGHVTSVRPVGNHVSIEVSQTSLCTTHAVITAGYHSAQLIQLLGLKAPIGVEHGYHLMTSTTGEMPTRPLAFHSESFLATPMSSGLRLAGTVELARHDAKPNWRRADQLLTNARNYMPCVATSASARWMGARPSFPDSLPAIGQIPGAPQISYAFGHQHLGLTLAAITARCVEAFVSGTEAPFDVSPFSLSRFDRRQRGPVKPLSLVELR